MNHISLIRALKTLEDQGISDISGITLRGMVDEILSCTVPDGETPKGWRRVPNPPRTGMQGQRIVWMKGA